MRRTGLLLLALAAAGCVSPERAAELEAQTERARAEARAAEAAAQAEAVRAREETNRLWLERDLEGFTRWALERQLERRRAACREKAFAVCGRSAKTWCADRRALALAACEALELDEPDPDR